jgi:putative hydrolases of HD superfamily
MTGDTFCNDVKANEYKAEREEKAAKRLFNLLSQDQAKEIWGPWREFEETKTPEACFAACLDRLQPLILNYNTGGHTWQKPGVNREKVLARNKVLEKTRQSCGNLPSKSSRIQCKRGCLNREGG